MIASMAGVALALQLGVPAHPLNESIPLAQEILAQEIRYRRHGHPPPCGHGYDLDERDGKCTRTGWCRRGFNRAGIIPWSTAAAGGRCPAITARTAIFATGSATRRARCHGSIRTAARAITIDETATTKCDSVPTLNVCSSSN